jgi:NAD(P)-dependent dehydrogenase (short-subunit alcohol dehydrogenase family)
MEKKEKKRVVLVTGISGGIGNGIGEYFMGKGWDVIGVDKNFPDHSNFTYFLKEDLTKQESVDSIFCFLKENYEELNCLVNNAALQICSSFLETKKNDFEEIFCCNVKTPFFLSKTFVPFISKCQGSIVNISSVHALATSKNIAAYSISKSALTGLTRTLALELAEKNIRVNGIMPGAIDTPMLRRGLARKPDFTTEEALSDLIKKHPLKRIGTPKDVAAVVYFLAQQETSGFITGQHFVIDGGVSIQLSSEV